MNPQKTEYFDSLVGSTSQKSQELSKALTESHTSKFIQEVSLLLASRNKLEEQDLDKEPQSRYKLPLLNQRLKTLQPKMKESSISNHSCSRSIQSEEEFIEKYRYQMSRVKKTRQHYERLLIGDEERLRKIKIEKEITACIRKEQDLRREIEYQEEVKRERSMKEVLIEGQRSKKKEIILKRLEKLNQHKQERQKTLASKSLPVIPKYKIMERVFLMQEIKQELNKKLAGKKLHEVRYKDYLKDQHSSRRSASFKQKNKKRIKTETDQNKIDKKELLEKRKALFQMLEDKRKHTIMKFDKEKSHLLQIAKDKTKNPQKYHFLKLKNLTDEQIYKDFQDFQFDFDSKGIGNQYMQDSKSQLKKEKSEAPLKSSRVDSIPTIARFSNVNKEQQSLSKVERSEYSSKHGRKVSLRSAKIDQSKKHKQQIQRIMRESESKSKVIELLSLESSNNNRNIVKLQKLLTEPTEYHQFLKIQKNMDAEYLNFLKAKIVTLGLHHI